MNQIQIMTIHKCDLKCYHCPNSIIPQTGDLMNKKLFSKIIDELAEMNYEKRVSLYLMNEPFLDKRIFEFIKETRSKLPNARINLSTNGVKLTIKNADKAFKNGLSDMDISCYTKEIYNKWKNYPANVMNMINYGPMCNNRGGNIPEMGRQERAGVGYCERPFIQMYINVWGEAVLCCSDYKREVVMGDVNKEKLIDIWNNKKYQLYREHLKQGIRDLPLCEKCNYV